MKKLTDAQRRGNLWALSPGRLLGPLPPELGLPLTCWWRCDWRRLYRATTALFLCVGERELHMLPFSGRKIEHWNILNFTLFLIHSACFPFIIIFKTQLPLLQGKIHIYTCAQFCVRAKVCEGEGVLLVSHPSLSLGLADDRTPLTQLPVGVLGGAAAHPAPEFIPGHHSEDHGRCYCWTDC